MKGAYPIVMEEAGKDIVVYIPDFDCNTQGSDYADAMEMARDAIGLMGITMEDDKKAIPKPSDLQTPAAAYKGLVTLVDVDFGEYRKANDLRTVRRTVCPTRWTTPTMPSTV